jgi:hypothetical protein
MDPAVLRSLERILVVAIGGLSILLGYRLFLAMPEQRDSTGTIRLPWNISIVLSRVGPGVFFALFGAAIVAFDLRASVSITEPTSGGARSYAGIGPGAAPSGGDSLAVRRMRAGLDIEFLNTLPLKAELSDQERRMAAARLASIKLTIMEGLWDRAWGDAEAFREWIDAGAENPVPEGLREAARFYRSGLGDGK